MKYFLITTILLALCCISTVSAGQAESFDEARILSAQSGKPILMEFVHTD